VGCRYYVSVLSAGNKKSDSSVGNDSSGFVLADSNSNAVENITKAIKDYILVGCWSIHIGKCPIRKRGRRICHINAWHNVIRKNWNISRKRAITFGSLSVNG